jgi:transposase
MLKLEFTPEVIEALRHERFHYPHPHVQLKLEVLYLKSQGLAGEHIQRLCAISKATYYRYLEEYRKGGLAHLKEVTVSARESALHAYRGTLEAYFLAHPPATVAEAQAKMAELTGITRGPTQVRQFLHGLGMTPRKVGTIPAKAEVEVQEAFKKKVWSRA